MTRVVFVPFGDIVAFSALTLASLQLGRMPGTVYLVACSRSSPPWSMRPSLAARQAAAHRPRPGDLWRAAACSGSHRRGSPPEAPSAAWAQIPLAVALVVPIACCIERIALRPIADASVLLLLIVSVALTFGLSGLALMFFGSEGFRTKPLASAVFRFGRVTVTSQTSADGRGCSGFQPAIVYVLRSHAWSGKALRATAINRLGARLVGIRPATPACWPSPSPRCSARSPACSSVRSRRSITTPASSSGSRLSSAPSSAAWQLSAARRSARCWSACSKASRRSGAARSRK